MMALHRWMKFWPQDFENDPAVKMCSLAAQGLWIRMICRMHDGSPYGHLTFGGRPWQPEKLAVLVGLPFAELKALLAELRENGVFSETPEGVIYSRRMVRDAEQAQAGRDAANWRWEQERARKGDGNTLPNTPPIREASSPSNTQEAEAESYSDSFASPSAPPQKSPSSVGHYLPEGWTPSTAGRTYAVERGLNVDREIEAFWDHWAQASGSNARKRDWDAAWRTWCRNAVKFGGSKPAPAKADTNYARNTLGSFL